MIQFRKKKTIFYNVTLTRLYPITVEILDNCFSDKINIRNIDIRKLFQVFYYEKEICYRVMVNELYAKQLSGCIIQVTTTTELSYDTHIGWCKSLGFKFVDQSSMNETFTYEYTNQNIKFNVFIFFFFFFLA